MEKSIEAILENLRKHPQTEPVRSTSNPMIRSFGALSQKKARDESGYFLVSGLHMVQEAAEAGLLEAVIYDEKSFWNSRAVRDALKADFDKKKEPVFIACKKNALDKLTTLKSGTTIVGLCKKMSCSLDGCSRILLLEHVQDPGNVGTLIRSACAFGADCVFLSDDSADLYNPKVLQSTQGACFHIPVLSGGAIDAVAKIKSENIPVYAAALHHVSVPLSSLKKPESWCLMIGSEGQGLSEKILSMADVIVHIEMQKFESLNAAVAGSILLYAFEPDCGSSPGQ